MVRRVPMQLRALSWNLFHGRDFPPDPALFTLRSRLLRITERDATHVQVNRDLLPSSRACSSGADWDVALLQECPPRWAGPLARACDAEAHRVPTSRNALGTASRDRARINPDLVGSNEGGSNLTLVRVDLGTSPSAASWCLPPAPTPSAGRWPSPGSGSRRRSRGRRAVRRRTCTRAPPTRSPRRSYEAPPPAASNGPAMRR